LLGPFCGVLPTAAVTFPPQFRGSIIVGKWEIVRRGRGAWHFDKNGKISCVWIAKSDDK